jgi:hypothetical protein
MFQSKNDYLQHIQNKNKCCETSLHNDIIYKCNYCKMMFTRASSLKRHQSKSCKILRSLDNDKEKLFQMLLDERSELTQQCNNMKKEIENYKCIINNSNVTNSHNTTTNIQNTFNIKILPFGKEDTSYISKKDYMKIIDHGFMSVPALIEKIHFNKDKPQNHNMYISNMRDDYILIFDGIDWKLVDKNETLDNLYSDNTSSLEDKFNIIIHDLSSSAITKFKRFLDKYDDDITKNNIKKELKLLLYNHRKMIQKTKKQNI